MAGAKEIKRRIKSVKNTKKITKAMELVAASKMKRAVSSTLASRLYAQYSFEILVSVAKNLEENKNPFFAQREVKNVLLILITSNRGLCGAYNAQVIKRALTMLKYVNKNAKVNILTIGKKGDIAMRRVNQNIFASFFELPDNISLSDITSISKLVIDEYRIGNYEQVLVAYTDFISALTQRPNIKQILPISKIDLKEIFSYNQADISYDQSNVIFDGKMKAEQKIDYLIEGDADMLLESLAEKITKMQIYQMLLESNASEQSSRMVAMRNASEASGEMIDDLTLAFNKARQANITREISEISAGMASVN